MLRETDLIIDDNNWEQYAADVTVDGHRMSRGCVPRDLEAHPVGSIPGVASVNPRDLPLIPREEWSSRIRDQAQAGARLSDIRLTGGVDGGMIPSLDQNGQGYCWAYSPTAALMLLRAKSGQAASRLSAHAVGCKIKNFRDQGGWSPQAVEFITANGVPDVTAWPEKSMSRSNDNAATWDNAKQYKIVEGWWDLAPAVYDRKLTFDQVATCLLLCIPVPSDFYWWGHSVCAMDLVEFDSSLPLSDINRWGVRIWNSWTDRWGDRGTSVLRGRKAVPDGATAPRASHA
jgi:C1A family cysteine protease